jgi:aspartate racemase
MSHLWPRQADFKLWPHWRGEIIDNRLSRRNFIASGAGAVILGVGSSNSSEPPKTVPGGHVMKTIGVLGGLGPQATMDFEARVHRVAQRLIPPHLNAGYPPMVVYYCRHPPVLLTDTGTPQLPIRPDPRLLDAAKRLGALADFLVIPSNTPHLVQAEIEQAAGRKVVSIVEATLAEVRRRQWKRVGVLGLGEPVVYTRPLAELAIACEIIDAGPRATLDAAIFRLMEGRNDAESFAVARQAVTALRDRGVDGVILGCTEIPLLLREAADEEDLMNPSQLLAEAAVKAAMM